MKTYLVPMLLGGLLLAQSAKAQEADTLVVVSYNVENFFHPDDDPAKADEAFTPEGNYGWNMQRMRRKALKISRVVMSLNGWKQPHIVGMCEVEGRKALDTLIDLGGLDACGYKGICFPTPDARGISTALIYNSYEVKLLSSHAINASQPENNFITRDILYAKFLFHADTFHIMVNHWPSKYGGEAETVWKRNHVAGVARHACDSIRATSPNAKIVLLGDFNDVASASAFTEVLGARENGSHLVNLSGDTDKYSYKYRGGWSTIDHIIVSSSLCSDVRPRFSVCDLPFLLEDDERNFGKKPFRTFIGLRYNEGYSDHLPVMIKIPVEKR